MFHLYFGSDREKVRGAVDDAFAKETCAVVRITDAHSQADFQTALQGGGLFNEKKIVVLDGLISGDNEQLSAVLLDSLPSLAKSEDLYFIIEGALDASTRKLIEKFAQKTARFDSGKKEEKSTIFALASALKSGNKKALWIGYHREIGKGSAPEAIHGVLFWAAKDMFMNSRGGEQTRAASLVAQLAELPHKARREGFELECALELFTLSGV